MRLTTWNVNGIRNPFSYPPWNTSRSFQAMFDTLESDIVVMQELKIQRKDLRDDMVLVNGWDCYFSLPKHKKGYSGVGIYTRNAVCAPTRAEEGILGVLPSSSGTAYRDLPDNESIGGYPSELQIAELEIDPAVLDAEGRCVVVEFPAFVLFGVYSPANSNGQRDDFRYGFVSALDCRIRNLVRDGKRVVLVGDLNVSRHEIDSAPTLEDMRKGNTSHEDFISSPNRRVFNQLLIDGEVIGGRDEGRETGVLWDTTRLFHPDRKGMFTCWETKVNARPGNYGARIDFVLVAETMRSWVQGADIQEGLLGSDHCPVYADFKDVVTLEGNDVPLVDIMNPPGVFQHGVRKLEWKLLSAPSFSAKRMPEFDKRQNIMTMFAASSQKARAPQSQPVSQPGSAKDITGDENSTTADSESVPLAHVSEAPLKYVDGSVKSEMGGNEKKPSTKRKASTATAKDSPAKRAKSSMPSSSSGQQSLKGFFQARASQANGKAQKAEESTVPATTSPVGANLGRDQSSNGVIVAKDALSDARNPTNATDDADPSPPGTPTSKDVFASPRASPSPTNVALQIASAEESQRSWGALFAKPAAPMCEGHEEPCKTMQTKKKGPNQGRSFWMCNRPLGPSGEKEKGTQWRCGTFIWCSDWSSRKESGKTASPAKAAQP
ncbi:related to DNA lyase Apn2 [Ramularia collo-cygni]|uniref:DNA-(apurinic or apyrimidinic site) endonuclease 2 n=1 Tax=Ramularia collo-cygni TaxID=112498 RepID=A0A2D3UVT5_9PEZI|nr:related to DNA lyase Apn2 [Ramularia collo-cygni]CZT15136.1 related to DNA lyase Apn2 [Ramularia collo-cygni]